MHFSITPVSLTIFYWIEKRSFQLYIKLKRISYLNLNETWHEFSSKKWQDMMWIGTFHTFRKWRYEPIVGFDLFLIKKRVCSKEHNVSPEDVQVRSGDINFWILRQIYDKNMVLINFFASQLTELSLFKISNGTFQSLPLFWPFFTRSKNGPFSYTSSWIGYLALIQMKLGTNLVQMCVKMWRE